MAKADEKHEVLKFEGGKTISFRPMKIKDYSMAAEQAGRAATNQYTFTVALQHELIKLLVVAVDGKKLTATQREDLDQVMSVQEYNACMEYVGEAVGKAPVVSRAIASAQSGDK